MFVANREQELLDSLGEDAKAHPLYRDEHGRLRFEQRQFPADRENAIKQAWFAFGDGSMSKADFQKFYRDIGYSLGGYCELMDQV